MPCLYPDTVKKTRHTDGAVLFDSEVLTGNDKPFPSFLWIEISGLFRTPGEAPLVFLVLTDRLIIRLPGPAQLLYTDLAAGGIGHCLVFRRCFQIPGEKIGISDKTVVSVYIRSLSAFCTSCVVEAYSFVETFSHFSFPGFRFFSCVKLSMDPVTLFDQIIH